MSRQGRSHRWGSTVHVFNRTLGQLHRLKPAPKLVHGIERLLIELQARYRMKLLAYAFLSNHFHLVLTIRSTHQLSAFMRDLQSGIALLSYEVFKGPELFWVPRFRSQELCTHAAVRRKIRYVCSHGTKEGIVPNPADWGGPTSAKQMRDPAAAPRIRVVDKRGVARMRVLQICPAPMDVGAPFSVWQRRQAALVASIETEFRHLKFTGMARTMAIPALWGPPQLERPSRAPMVQWDCTDADGLIDEGLLEQVKVHYAETLNARADAVERMVRRGICQIEFPVDSPLTYHKASYVAVMLGRSRMLAARCARHAVRA